MLTNSCGNTGNIQRFADALIERAQAGDLIYLAKLYNSLNASEFLALKKIVAESLERCVETCLKNRNLAAIEELVETPDPSFLYECTRTIIDPVLITFVRECGTSKEHGALTRLSKIDGFSDEVICAEIEVYVHNGWFYGLLNINANNISTRTLKKLNRGLQYAIANTIGQRSYSFSQHLAYAYIPHEDGQERTTRYPLHTSGVADETSSYISCVPRAVSGFAKKRLDSAARRTGSILHRLRIEKVEHLSQRDIVSAYISQNTGESYEISTSQVSHWNVIARLNERRGKITRDDFRRAIDSLSESQDLIFLARSYTESKNLQQHYLDDYERQRDERFLEQSAQFKLFSENFIKGLETGLINALVARNFAIIEHLLAKPELYGKVAWTVDPVLSKFIRYLASKDERDFFVRVLRIHGLPSEVLCLGIDICKRKGWLYDLIGICPMQEYGKVATRLIDVLTNNPRMDSSDDRYDLSYIDCLAHSSVIPSDVQECAKAHSCVASDQKPTPRDSIDLYLESITSGSEKPRRFAISPKQKKNPTKLPRSRRLLRNR